MKTKNYFYIHHSTLRHIPERYLLQKICYLSKELRKETDITDLLLKKSQREYYLQELVRRDENTIL